MALFDDCIFVPYLETRRALMRGRGRDKSSKGSTYMYTSRCRPQSGLCHANSRLASPARYMQLSRIHFPLNCIFSRTCSVRYAIFARSFSAHRDSRDRKFKTDRHSNDARSRLVIVTSSRRAFVARRTSVYRKLFAPN